MRSRSYSYSPSPSRSYRRRRSPSPRDRYHHGRESATSLLVRNLRRDCRPEDLRGPFGRFGPIKDIYLPRDYYSGEPRGFGFVQFVDPADAADAKYEMNGYVLLGRELTVVFAEENRKKPSEMRARQGSRLVWFAFETFLSVHPLLTNWDLLLKGGTLMIVIALDRLDVADHTLGLRDVADRILSARIIIPQGVGTIQGPPLLVTDRDLMTGGGRIQGPPISLTTAGV
ncbi:Serine/arginine-rich SC35-like splicing factor SCL30A-like protein [Drosera capensis]